MGPDGVPGPQAVLGYEEEGRVLHCLPCSWQSPHLLRVSIFSRHLALPCSLPDLCLHGVFASIFFVLSNPEAFFLVDSVLCQLKNNLEKAEKLLDFLFINTPAW